MKSYIKEYFAKLNIEIDDMQAEQLVTYKNMLAEWNGVMNLTGITEDREVVIKHFGDSVSLLGTADLRDKSVIDVGTGAGFPGLPLKIACPSIKLTLLDSLRKRLDFLKAVCDETGIKAELVHGRAEDMAHDERFREKYDIAVSRAVAELNILSELDMPFVKRGGLMLALKGPSAYEEAERAENAVKTLGGEIKQIKEIILPDTDLGHTAVIIEKTGNTPEKYPRRFKKIEKSPL